MSVIATMSDTEDHDDFEELLLLEDILISEEEKENTDRLSDTSECKSPTQLTVETEDVLDSKAEETSSDNEPELSISDEVIAEYKEAISLNKKLIKRLLGYRVHITVLSKKCERKLELVEARLNGNVVPNTKLLTCNAGQPYFKDKAFFCAPSNEDELVKERRGEVQLDSLPKVFGWNSKERCMLLKAIKHQALSNVCEDVENQVADSNGAEEGPRKSKREVFVKNFRQIVGPLGQKEFDWFKISVLHFPEKHSPTDCRAMWNVFLHPDINKARWKKKSEDNRLKMLAEKYRCQDWDHIAYELGGNRSAYQCFVRYNTTRKLPKARNCIWTTSEDEQLVSLVEAFKVGDYIPWGDVASWMPDRTKQQVYFRWTYSLAPYLVKGRFTKKEDNTLKEAVSRYGRNFCKISAALMPSRSTIQLNDHYARLAIKASSRTVWSLANDIDLLDMYERFGPNWSRIAKTMGTRTRTQIRHRYAAIQRSASRRQAISAFRAERSGESCRGITDQGEGTEAVTEDQAESESREYELVDSEDVQLLEFFRTEQRKQGRAAPPGEEQEQRSNHDALSCQQLNSPDALSCLAKEVYSLLRALNATVSVPDNLDGIELVDDNERQLYSSIRDHIAQRNDPARNKEIVERCSLRMFGPERNDERTSHFVPPLAFDTYVRSRKSKKTDTIDYVANGAKNYLVERPAALETPEVVISSVGGEEENLKFEKLEKLLLRSSSTGSHRNTLLRKIYVLSPQLLNWRMGCRVTTASDVTTVREAATTVASECSYRGPRPEQCSETPTTNSLLMEDLSRRPSIPYLDAPVEAPYQVPYIEPLYETLLAFKKLKYLRNIADRMHPRSDNGEQVSDQAESETTSMQGAQDEYKLLEGRLEQLFKYPFGLSKTTLPQFHGSDILFSPEIAVAEGRKRSRSEEMPTKRRKRLTEAIEEHLSSGAS